MSDFYSELAARENEAMRRAGRLREAERAAAEDFSRAHSRYAPAEPPRQEPAREHKNKSSSPFALFDSLGVGGDLFSSSDSSILILLFFILRTEQSDPLLTLALLYILM